jgi:hypothetical protein
MNNLMRNISIVAISSILLLNTTTIIAIRQQKTKKTHITRNELFKRRQYRIKKNLVRMHKKPMAQKPFIAQVVTQNALIAHVVTQDALIKKYQQSVFCSPTKSYRKNEKLIQKIAQEAAQQAQLTENLALNQHQTLTALAHIHGSTPLLVQHKPREIMIHENF